MWCWWCGVCVCVLRSSISVSATDTVTDAHAQINVERGAVSSKAVFGGGFWRFKLPPEIFLKLNNLIYKTFSCEYEFCCSVNVYYV